MRKDYTQIRDCLIYLVDQLLIYQVQHSYRTMLYLPFVFYHFLFTIWCVVFINIDTISLTDDSIIVNGYGLYQVRGIRHILYMLEHGYEHMTF